GIGRTRVGQRTSSACLRLGLDPRRALGPAAHPLHQQAGHGLGQSSAKSNIRRIWPLGAPSRLFRNLRAPSSSGPETSLLLKTGVTVLRSASNFNNLCPIEHGT